MTESRGAGRVRQASVADVEVILQHRRSMFADRGVGDEAQRDEMTAAGPPHRPARVRPRARPAGAWLLGRAEARVVGNLADGNGVVEVGHDLELAPRTWDT